MAVFHGHQRFPFLFHKGEIVPIGKTIVKHFQFPSRHPFRSGEYRRAAGIRLEYDFAMVHAIRFLIRLEARAVAGAHHVAGRSFLQAAQSSITVGHFII